MFAVILCLKYIRKTMLQEDNILPLATKLPFLSALLGNNDTTNLFGYKLGKSAENNKALLFFSGTRTILTLMVLFKALRFLQSDKLVKSAKTSF